MASRFRVSFIVHFPSTRSKNFFSPFWSQVTVRHVLDGIGHEGHNCKQIHCRGARSHAARATCGGFVLNLCVVWEQGLGTLCGFR